MSKAHLDPTLPDAAPPGAPEIALPARYRDLGRIASGGCGDVRRALDTQFDRVVAIKTLRWEHVGSAEMRARFLVEAEVTAQLEHPAIVAVHERGELTDGRLWFTMKEVRGRTLREAIDEVHAASGPEGFRPAPSGWTFRRLVDAFARVAEAMAFAHRRGVVHRDLKPDNVMVGDYGEVLVMDWGLARRAGSSLEEGAPAEVPALSDDDAERLTRAGEVLGTPAYMPPEQASGQRHRHGPESDVYALGAILYFLLAGRPPYLGKALGVLRQVLAGPPVPVAEAARGGPPVPSELAALCERAMSRAIEARHPDAAALLDEVVAWLDGARRREQAHAVLHKAAALPPVIAGLRGRAGRLVHEAKALLGAVRPFDPVERKQPAWALEDEAAALDVEAALRETEWLEAVHGALSVDPDLSEAHAVLADHYRARLVEAERAQQQADAARFEALLRAHDRGQHGVFLHGEGALTVVTDPPGAVVRVERFVLRSRRLVPVDEGVLGETPLRAVTMRRGSYRLRLKAPGRAEVIHPVLVERGEHWDGCAPGEREPYPVPLPAEGELGPDEVYVPPGWCWIGGDAAAADGLPGRRVWVDGFVIARFPVTNAEYLVFLDALVASGREAEALAACPRDPPGISGAARTDRIIYGRGEGGRFVLAGEEGGRRWGEGWPVALIDWYGARAYAAWLAARTGKAWRLPGELEREKAARGADARLFPWGNHLEATFACAAESQARPVRVDVTAFPVDESPYGVRALAGNMRDYCLEVWQPAGPPVRGGRAQLAPADPADASFRAVRGGGWTSPVERSRSAARFANLPTDRRETIGVRVARSYGGSV